MKKTPSPWSVHSDGDEYEEFRRYQALVARHKQAETRRIRAQKARRYLRLGALALLKAYSGLPKLRSCPCCWLSPCLQGPTGLLAAAS
jgi:hypothetical protein